MSNLIVGDQNLFHVIALGAGVQSSTMALMAAAGELSPMPQAAIFADTQSEPASVYRWLDWLEKRLPFPVHRVTRGDLGADSLRIHKSQKSGRAYRLSLIPMFNRNSTDGKAAGLLHRQCTRDYKILPLTRKLRELAGVKRGQSEQAAMLWMGISLDEAHRMKPSRFPFLVNAYPLVDLRMTRTACLRWMEDRGYPTPPRSACVFCPYHNDKEWREMKHKEPDEFRRAVEWEQKNLTAEQSNQLSTGIPFLHRSLQPLNTVDFTESNQGQLNLFGNECEGMCGV